MPGEAGDSPVLVCSAARAGRVEAHGAYAPRVAFCMWLLCARVLKCGFSEAGQQVVSLLPASAPEGLNFKLPSISFG